MIYHLLADVFTGLIMLFPGAITVVIVLIKFEQEENPHD